MRPTLVFLTAAICLVAGFCLAQEETPAPEAEQVEQTGPSAPIDLGPRPTLDDPLTGRLIDTETSEIDRSDLALTVYHSDMALVRERRSVQMLPGVQRLRFRDISGRMLPETVNLRSVSAPTGLRVLEQNYRFDPVTENGLLEAYVGKKVRLQNLSRDVIMGVIEAELLAAGSEPIFRIGDEVYIGHPGSVVLPELPEQLTPKPMLQWLLETDETEHDLELTYLTSGVSWSADYVAALSDAGDAFDLNAWVTLNNATGIAFPDVRIKLVAGEVSQAESTMGSMMGGDMVLARDVGAMAPAPLPVRDTLSEFSLYTLPRRTTLQHNERKQVSLFSASDVKAEVQYELVSPSWFFSAAAPEMPRMPVQAYVTAVNEESAGLGRPLPQGAMMVYRADAEGEMQLVGHDRLELIPVGEKVRIRLGAASELTAERKQTAFRRLGEGTTESAYEVRVRNSKDALAKVDVIESLAGEWEIQEKSHEFTKRDAATAVFSVEVPAKGETVVSYRVWVRYQ